jgi:hypothetical protein
MLSPVTLATWPIFAARLTASLNPIITLQSGADSRVKRFPHRATAGGPGVCCITALPLSGSLTKGDGQGSLGGRQVHAGMPELVAPNPPVAELRQRGIVAVFRSR